MRNLVEINLGIVEMVKSDWSYADQYGELRIGKNVRVEFLTAEGELKEFANPEDFYKTLPTHRIFYRIGCSTKSLCGRRGHRFETRESFYVNEVLL